MMVLPPPNVPPVVNLTAPLNGAIFQGPTSLVVAADASDVDGQIARVDFFTTCNLTGTSNKTVSSSRLIGSVQRDQCAVPRSVVCPAQLECLHPARHGNG